ncbi:fasciclin domain-containing protein [Maribacter sp. 2307ULW6-5]|uniref:fasciclin domain-containing protein n=1 Tax=Maribacter sp. 2307ULW6-5 TaxID=3386275 RepID=UPI0039BD5260
MKKYLKLKSILLLAVMAFVAVSCEEEDNPAAPPISEGSNIVVTAQGVNDLSTLVAALQKADESANNDLVAALSDESATYTVLAPNNAAFGDLLNRLDGFSSLDDFNDAQLQDLLATILTYHVAAGARVESGDLTDGGTITTLEGSTVTVSLDGGAGFVDAAGETATVISADNNALNGVIHIIDKVLLPQAALDALEDVLLQSITDLAIATPDLSILVEALIAADADLPNTLRGAGPFTVFAPTNAAFAEFLEDNNFSGLGDIPTEVLQQVLLNHVVSGNVMSTDLTEGYISTLSTAGPGERNLSMYVDLDDGVELNGGADVITADVKAINGVVHIVDEVIGLPNIVTHAVANDNFSALVGALTADGNTTFTDLLSSAATDFTVFAPVDAAFDAFTNPNGNDINAILANHVVAGAAAYSDGLTNTYVNTEATFAPDQKLSLYINTDDGVTLNGVSNVAVADVVATNGVIHAVDAVIDIPTVVTFATADPNFTSLVGALTADGQPDFVATLSTPNGTDPAPFTVFAPVNDAFAALAAVPEGAALTAVLQHHVIAGGNVRSGDLSDGLVSPATLEGDTVTFSITDGVVTITDGAGNSTAQVIAADVQAGNGVIHAVNTVLIPDTTN